MTEHAFNTSTLEAEAGGSPYREPISKTKRGKKNEKKSTI